MVVLGAAEKVYIRYVIKMVSPIKQTIGVSMGTIKKAASSLDVDLISWGQRKNVGLHVVHIFSIVGLNFSPAALWKCFKTEIVQSNTRTHDSGLSIHRHFC